MRNCKIEFVEKLPDTISEKMEKGLKEYEISHGINVDYKPFAFVLFDEKNEAIGVLDAFSSYSSIHIRDLWVDHVLNHWRALHNYLGNGTLNIDNNTAERAIKAIVIGRKNYMFYGSHEGAKKAAILYSLIETCKLNGINPFAYLKDVLTRLPTTLMKNLKQLLPYHWKPF